MPCSADMMGRARLASTVAACAFMPTSKAALAMPKAISARISKANSGMARMATVARA